MSHSLIYSSSFVLLLITKQILEFPQPDCYLLTSHSSPRRVVLQVAADVVGNWTERVTIKRNYILSTPFNLPN